MLETEIDFFFTLIHQTINQESEKKFFSIKLKIK